MVVVGVFMMGSRLTAVELGDSGDHVISEKGAPAGKIQAAGMEIWRYPDQTLKLREGRVVGIEMSKVPAAMVPSVLVPKAVAGPKKSSAAPTQLIAPEFSKQFVGEPLFETIIGRQSAGTIFVARRDNDPQIYLLTAHHLFGPAGGFPNEISHEKLPSFVRRIFIHDQAGGTTSRPVTGCVVPQGGDPAGPLADLAVFKTSGVAVADVPVLTGALPALGESVWIVAKMQGAVPEGTTIHRLVIIPKKGDWLMCEFVNPGLITAGASGAPVFNAKGEIVGIFSGHSDVNGHKFAFIIPSPLILSTLSGL